MSGNRGRSDEEIRPIFWIGGSKNDLSAMPGRVKASFGIRLFELQLGGKTLGMKRLAQFGPGVFELREAFDGNAYRAVFVLDLGSALYVLHAFMKKSKSGIGMPKPDIELIERRLARARQLAKEE